jgi:Zn-dependent protease with chaperone function
MTTAAARAGRVSSSQVGVWQLAVAAPAIVASGVLVAVCFAWLRHLDGLAVLGWFLCGAAMLTRAGERASVRVMCSFRALSCAQRRLVEPVLRSAHAVGEVPWGDIDWYVRRARAPNAYAVGGRSAALTSAFLEDLQAGRVSDDQFRAVVVHELGHHVTASARFSLATLWLAAPWRCVAGFLLGLTYGAFGRRQRPRTLVAVVAAGVVVAIVQTIERGAWLAAGLLGALVVCGVGVPLVDAAVARASERAADRFAVSAGVAGDLAAALLAISGGDTLRRGFSARLRARHPALPNRVEDLLATAAPGAHGLAGRAHGGPVSEPGSRVSQHRD